MHDQAPVGPDPTGNLEQVQRLETAACGPDTVPLEVKGGGHLGGVKRSIKT